MNKITAFETSDGMLFKSEEQAKVRELSLLTEQISGELFGHDKMYPSTFCNLMVRKRHEIIEFLSRLDDSPVP